MIPTVDFTMKYSDYLTTVAFIKSLEEWVNTCDNSDSLMDKLIIRAQNVSHYFALFSKIVMIIIILTWFNLALLPTLKIENLLVLTNYLVNFSGYLVIMFLLTHLFGKKLETSVDSYRSISYIDFNAVDKKIIKIAQPERVRKIGGHLFMLGFNILASIIASIIFVKYMQ